jgi:hypothetical protein
MHRFPEPIKVKEVQNGNDNDRNKTEESGFAR